jgi:predicted site-specific integrase-resolvase
LEAQVAGQRIGYVRVSTLDQNEKRQLDGQVLDRVFTDKASGRDTSRPELTELLRFARNLDTVIVHSMDRLARNLDDLRSLVQALTRKGVRVEFVKESLVFTGEDSPMANLMLSVMGAFAEFDCCCYGTVGHSERLPFGWRASVVVVPLSVRQRGWVKTEKLAGLQPASFLTTT